MVSRSDCLYNDKLLNISSIYTVVNGKQINIPGRVEQLRALGRAGQLLCPCGCGGQLILVAGQRGLRAQHFRMKAGSGNRDCHAVSETEESIQAKIVLRCWLVDHCSTQEIDYAVPPSENSGKDRRNFEFTFLVKNQRIGLVYWHIHANINQDKTEYLSSSRDADLIVYVANEEDAPDNGQYPEFCIKMQRAQGYCLFINTTSDRYEDAHLSSCRYLQDRFGEWKKVRITGGLLRNYRIQNGNLYPSSGHKSLTTLANEAEQKFLKQQDILAKKAEEDRRKRQDEQLKRQKQYQKELLQREIEARKREQRKAAEEAQRVLEQKKREAEQAKQRERRELALKKAEAEDHQKVLSLLGQNEQLAIDMYGKRWVKCKFCGKIATDGAFSTYGGVFGINVGICRECAQNHPEEPQITRSAHPGDNKKPHGRNTDPSVCPVCGGRLRIVHSRYGSFLSCNNYPKCLYHRNMPKEP